MNKKNYKRPTMKMVQLEDCDILTGSNNGPSAIKLNDEEVEKNESSLIPLGYGQQW